MERAKVKASAITCSACDLFTACLPAVIGFNHIPELERYTRPIGPLRRGEHLFHAGDTITGLLIVQSGFFKLYGVDQAGRQYIPGFRMPGDIIGLYGYNSGAYQFDAMALTTSTACRIDNAHLNEIAGKIPTLLTSILRMVAREFVNNIFLSGNFSAEERVTAFLSSLQDKLRDSEHPEIISLPMTHGDIAIYLHLALATLSRIFSRLQREGIIESENHHIRVLDQARLNLLCRNVPFVVKLPK